MRIVHLINHFQPKIGYQEFFLCKEWQKMGHQVTVVTSNYFFPFPEFESTVMPLLGERKRACGKKKERGIDTIRLKPSFMLPGGFVAWLNKLDDTLLMLKPDIVFADGVFQPLALQISQIKKKQNFLLSFDSHASSFNSNLRSSFIKKAYMFLFKLMITPQIKKAADAFTAVGKSEKKIVEREYGLKSKQVKLIHLGADTSIFYPDTSSRKTIRKKLGIKKIETVYIYAGKITENKDLHILIQSFAKLVKKNSNSKLLIIGTGSKKLMANLKELSRETDCLENTIWLAQQNHKNLAKYYNAADIGIWPGNLSNTIQECMACAKAVVVADKISKDQNTRHLSKAKGVFTFKRGSVLSLFQQMNKLNSKKSKLKKLGLESKRLIDQEFSWKKIAKKHLNVF